ncbi:MAG: hypothetical protein ABGY43_09235 [bacterium]
MRYQKNTVINFGNSVDTANNQVQRGLAQTQAIGRQVQAAGVGLLQKVVKKKGQADGLKAGQSGDGSLITGFGAFTTYGESHNAAFKIGFKSSSEVDIITRSAELAAEYKNDPAGLANAMQGWADGALDELPDELGAVWKGTFQNYYNANLRTAIAGKEQEQLAALQQQLASDYEVRIDALNDASYQGNLDLAADLRNSLFFDIDAAVEANVFTAAKGIKDKADITRKDNSQLFLGAFNRTLNADGGIEKGREMLDAFRRSKVTDENLGMTRLEMQAKMESLYYRAVRVKTDETKLQIAQTKSQSTQANNVATAAIKSFSNGIGLGEDEQQQIEDAYPFMSIKKQMELRTAIAEQNSIRDFITDVRATDRPGFIDALPLEKREIYQKALDNFDNQIKAGGVAFLDGFYNTDDYGNKQHEPLQYDDPKSVQARILKVSAYEAKLERHVPLLTPDESDQISNNLDNLIHHKKYDEVVGELLLMEKGFGDYTPEVLEQVTDVGSAGVYSVVGYMAQDKANKKNAVRVLKGQALMKDYKVKNLTAVVQRSIGSIFSGQYELASNSVHAVEALVTLQAYNTGGIDDAEMDIEGKDILKKAITSVTGGIYAGSYDTPKSFWNIEFKTVLPQGMDEEQFNKHRQNPPPRVLAAMDSALTDEEKRDRLANSRLIAVNYGKYNLQVQSNDSDVWLTVKDYTDEAAFIWEP